MNGDLELGWLPLADKSELVFTSLHVFQHEDRGIFGETKTVIPRRAITTVRIAWRRSKALLVLGILFLIVFLVFMVGSILAGSAGVGRQALAPAEVGGVTPEQAMSYARRIFSSSVAVFVQYGSLAAATGILALFWFCKRPEIQVMAPSGTLGGIPKSYEDADKFCTLLLSEIKDYPPPVKKDEAEATGQPVAGKSDWHL